MEKHFERPEVKNVEIAIFLNRLIGIFDMLMTKLEFAVNPSLFLLKNSFFH